MIVSIHQPNYLPYLGFFNKIKNSDVFILLDIVQYEKNGFQNRNRIRVKNGWIYLTIPLKSKDCYLKKIYEVKLPEGNIWKKKHWKSIYYNYVKAPYFESYRDFFERIYLQKKHKLLVEINEEIIRYLVKEFNLSAKIIKASDLNIVKNLKSTDLLIEIVKSVGGEIYLSGISGRKYLEEKKFIKKGIKVEYQNFIHPVYPQVYEGFEKNMAAIDLLFNVGEKSYNYI